MPSASDNLELEEGAKAHLLASLNATRAKLLAAVSLASEAEREWRPVCGQWTLKDLLGHIADWEAFGAVGLSHMASGQPPNVEYVHDIDGWNERRVREHRPDSWEDTIARLNLAHKALCEQVEQFSEADLTQSFLMPWGGRGTPYGWVSVYIGHDEEHAQDIISTFLLGT